MSLSFLNKNNYIQCFVSQIGIKRDKIKDDKLMGERVHKTLGASIIFRPISPPFLNDDKQNISKEVQ